MKEYIGIYEFKFIQTYYIKIKAYNKEQAKDKFLKYLDKEQSTEVYHSVINEDEVTIMNLDSIDII